MEAAINYLREACAIRGKIIADHPEHHTTARDLCLSLVGLAQCESDLLRIADARAHFDEATRLAERITRALPDTQAMIDAANYVAELRANFELLHPATTPH